MPKSHAHGCSIKLRFGFAVLYEIGFTGSPILGNTFEQTLECELCRLCQIVTLDLEGSFLSWSFGVPLHFG